MLVLGVDPGSQRTGYGAVRCEGRSQRLVEAGVLAPPSRFSLPEKLRLLHEGLSALVTRLRPDALAVEDVFHAANARSALVLGHVRGVVLLAGAQHGLPIHAFPPASVKLQLTGYGRAEKAQVALMVSRVLGLREDAAAGDAADALAVALCAAQLLVSAPVAASPAQPAAPKDLLHVAALAGRRRRSGRSARTDAAWARLGRLK
jgi:crossover junction endodeoxyribonuclease RuvC